MAIGDPEPLLTQEPIRILVSPTNTRVYLTQELFRALVFPTSPELMLTQVAVRVLRLNESDVIAPDLVLTQLVLRVLRLNDEGAGKAPPVEHERVHGLLARGVRSTSRYRRSLRTS